MAGADERRCDAVPVLPVSDLVRALAWYERLGFRINGEYPDYALLGFDDTEVHLAENPSIAGTLSMSGVYLRVPDADLVHARWMAMGVREVMPLTDQPYGIREFSTEDLEGNLIRVGSNIVGAGPGGHFDDELAIHAFLDDDGPVASVIVERPTEPVVAEAALETGVERVDVGAYDKWYGTYLADGRCIECGLDPDELPARAIGAEVRDESHSIAERLRAADDEAVRVHPGPSTWSALEYGVHVRDVLSLFADRIVRTLRQDRPELPGFDQDEAIADGMANESDVDAVADDLGRNAAKLSESLRLVTDDDWARPATRAGDPCTIESLARLTLHEVVHHRADIARILDRT
jgi:hypothetical protein